MDRSAPAPERGAFYRKIDPHHLAPLWEVMGALVPPAPRSACQPVHWSYAAIAPLLRESGALISAEQAERRVLVLENPALRGASAITRSLYAGYQYLLPGEVAPSHRHTATAIRLVVEGRGATTAVDGERTVMEPGDFIITPSWTFHDHANPGDQAVTWLDGLDVPLVQFMEAGFSERLEGGVQAIARPDDDSLDRYGANMLPDGDAVPARNPLFRYPYARTRAVLERLARSGPTDPCHGARQQFINPATGGPATRSMAAFMQWLPAGFDGAPHRSTDSTVYCVVEGSGATWVGEQCMRWEAHDVFVAPSWMPVRHTAARDAVLFSFSDRPVQQALGMWRHERIAG